MAKLIRLLINGVTVVKTESRHETQNKLKSRKMFSPTKPYQTPYTINGELIVDCLTCDQPTKHRDAIYVKVLTGEFKKDRQTDLLINGVTGQTIEVQRGSDIELDGFSKVERKPIKFDKWEKGMVCPSCSMKSAYHVVILKGEHSDTKPKDEHYEHEFGYGRQYHRNITHKRRASKIGRTASGWARAHEGRNQ